MQIASLHEAGNVRCNEGGTMVQPICFFFLLFSRVSKLTGILKVLNHRLEHEY
ncbi:hypothetical protein ACLOJK_020023 [Asimina triloba]